MTGSIPDIPETLIFNLDDDSSEISIACKLNTDGEDSLELTWGEIIYKIHFGHPHDKFKSSEEILTDMRSIKTAIELEHFINSSERVYDLPLSDTDSTLTFAFKENKERAYIACTLTNDAKNPSRQQNFILTVSDYWKFLEQLWDPERKTTPDADELTEIIEMFAKIGVYLEA